MRFWGFLLIFLFLAGVAQASTFEPSFKWRTIRTEHFSVHFKDNLEKVAQDTARILEEVHAKLSPELEWKPWGPTEVVLLDSTDESNGLTSVLPYNWMVLFVSQPPPESSLGNYDDWLRTLIYHEYTHLLHFDANRKFWKPLRLIFGKTVAPAGVTPGWVKEGFAVYEESAKTTAGRNRASYSDMLLRAAVTEDNFPTIDRADGMHWRWPSYNTAYIFGGKFVKYLVDTYGEGKFLEFNKRVQSSPLLSMVNHQARNVYHKTFYELWREWQASLRQSYDQLETELEREGLTPTEEIVLPSWEDQFSYPIPLPDGQKLVYIASSPHHATEIRLSDLTTGEKKRIAKKKATSVAVGPDGKFIAYSAIGTYKRYNYFNDLYLYDVEKKKTKGLTSGKRARDPSFSPSGKKIIFLTEDAGKDVINILDVKTKKSRVVVDNEREYPHYATPRFSPDGRFFAVSVHTPQDGWKVYIYSADGQMRRRLTEGKGMESSPWWMPDGNYVLFASDETGISNIYRAEVLTGRTEKITNVLTGVFEPATRDGYTVYVRQYNSRGFYVARFTAPPSKFVTMHTRQKLGGKKMEPVHDVTGEGQTETTLQEGAAEESEEPADYRTEKYCPLGRSLLLPRFISPFLAYIEDAVFVSFLTGGMDPLRWHGWLGGVTYRTDADHVGYYGQYWYNRWLPVFGVGINDYAVDLGLLTFRYASGQTRTVDYYEERRNAHAFFALPIKNHHFKLSYFYEDRMPITSLTPDERAVLNLGIFAGFLGQYQYGDAERYPASISAENGRLIKLTGMVTDHVFGSGERNEQIIFAGDWREYIRLWHHHVLGLRAAGGITWGDRLVQGTFALGGDVGEGVLASGGSWNYFPLRGLPVATIARTRAMLLSAEYRFPIFSPQRGIGTWPFFLNNLHMAFFADYGDAWNADENEGGFTGFFDDFLLGVGTELRGDFVIGHGLPFTGRVGYAIIVVNRDRIRNLTAPIIDTDLKYGMLILQFGTSF